MSVGYTQWTNIGDRFFPAGDVVKTLPPGYYSLDSSMTQGLYFQTKKTKSEELVKFPDSHSDAVLEEINKFWALEGKFREADIPYKRGMMLYGPPGSGKTCTIRLAIDSLVNEHDGIVIDFPGTYLFKDGYPVLREINEGLPLVVLMEDMDAILRQSNESDVLNLLDGIFDIDRTIFLATTNYPEQLGGRILNRPSRFDKKFFIGMPSAEAREVYIRTKFKDDDDKQITRMVEDTDGMSIAHIKELYVAHKILGDTYENSIQTLRDMASQSSSSSFDNFHIADDYDRPEEAVRSYRESKEKYYSQFGTGKVYQEAVKRKGQMIPEGNGSKKTKKWSSPDEIGGMIVE